jgi:phosphatidylglycerol:prolipoprotein diacylglycerol transferase
MHLGHSRTLAKDARAAGKVCRTASAPSAGIAHVLLVANDTATAVAYHTALEMAGIFVGARAFACNIKRHAVGGITGATGFAVAFGCILGAITGSRIAVWLDAPDRLVHAWTNVAFPGGQSIVGALIGGLLGVEIAKRWAGVRVSTGDAFVVPIAVGIAIGRVGCFIAGLHDDTYGVATALPWGVDFGDGVHRHPTQLYDIAFVAALALALQWRSASLARVPGLSFKLFLAAYLGWRLIIDALKPVHYAYPGGLSGLQLLAAAFLVAYALPLVRGLRRLG